MRSSSSRCSSASASTAAPRSQSALHAAARPAATHSSTVCRDSSGPIQLGSWCSSSRVKCFLCSGQRNQSALPRDDLGVYVTEESACHVLGDSAQLVLALPPHVAVAVLRILRSPPPWCERHYPSKGGMLLKDEGEEEQHGVEN